MPSTIITISRGYHCSRRLQREIQHTWVETISTHMPRFSTIVASTIKRWPAAHSRCNSLAFQNKTIRWILRVITCRGGHGGLNWPDCKCRPSCPFGVRTLKITRVFGPFYQCLSLTVSSHPIHFLNKVCYLIKILPTEVK